VGLEGRGVIQVTYVIVVDVEIEGGDVVIIMTVATIMGVVMVMVMATVRGSDLILTLHTPHMEQLVVLLATLQ